MSTSSRLEWTLHVALDLYTPKELSIELYKCVGLVTCFILFAHARAQAAAHAGGTPPRLHHPAGRCDSGAAWYPACVWRPSWARMHAAGLPMLVRMCAFL